MGLRWLEVDNGLTVMPRRAPSTELLAQALVTGGSSTFGLFLMLRRLSRASIAPTHLPGSAVPIDTLGVNNGLFRSTVAAAGFVERLRFFRARSPAAGRLGEGVFGGCVLSTFCCGQGRSWTTGPWRGHMVASWCEGRGSSSQDSSFHEVAVETSFQPLCQSFCQELEEGRCFFSDLLAFLLLCLDSCPKGGAASSLPIVGGCASAVITCSSFSILAMSAWTFATGSRGVRPGRGSPFPFFFFFHHHAIQLVAGARLRQWYLFCAAK